MSTTRNHLDNLSRALTQASAMAQMIHGNGAENFQSCSVELQDNYLWALSDKIQEARATASQIPDALCAESMSERNSPTDRALRTT